LRTVASAHFAEGPARANLFSHEDNVGRAVLNKSLIP
jgi:hypothetical protein